jgi:F420-non-reducing hydrogenase small subunit
VDDQGATVVSALGSILDVGDYKGLTREQLTENVETVLNSIPDGAGTFYRFSAASSILGGTIE